MKQLPFILCALLLTIQSFGQGETIGLVHYDPNVSDGYTLFAPLSNNKVYLIDNCGEKINEWEFYEGAGATCYLLANGNVLRAGQDSLTIHDWNNALVWSYAMAANGIPQHHDIEPLPNGNILALIREVVSTSTAIAQGRDPSFIGGNVKLERIVELEPVGSNGANIVWDWHFTDHLIQDIDNSKLNFGVVDQHPELVDYNYDNGRSSDWVHANALEYNATLDQIMLSARHLSEIYIIDHSTSTAQAASHSGGDFGKGGDFLWRWGNPQVYGQGGPSDQKLFQQHDPQWVRPGYPDEGKISVFNNDGDQSGSFSSVHLIEPSIFGTNYVLTNNRFDPLNFDWSWDGSILGTLVYQPTRSGCQSQSNGNMTLCETNIGRVSEVDKMGNLVWSYVNPTGPTIYAQGTPISSMTNGVFRAEKYPSNYPGLTGQNLSPQGIIENSNAFSAACAISTGIVEESGIQGIINPSFGGRIVFNELMEADELRLISLSGQVVFKQKYLAATEVSTGLEEGLYLLQIRQGTKVSTTKVLLQ